MSTKIVFISPDEKLTQKAKEVVAMLGDNIDVYQGSLSDGVIAGRQAVENGARIIISRGGTGNLIKKNLQVPVVKVEISGYDILNAISKAITSTNKVGVVGFDNLVSSAQSISSVMKEHFNIEIFTAAVKNERDVEKKMEQLYTQGVRGFVGGITVVSTAANRFCCHGVLLDSGQEAITEAIREAKHVLEVQTKEKEKAEMMKSIIDFAYDGIIGIDTNGCITVFNPIAEKVLGFRSEDVIGKLIDDVIPNTRMLHVLRSGEAEKEQFQKIGDVTIATNRVPILVNDEVLGVVATFQETERIQKMEHQIRKKMYLKGHVAKARLEDIIGNSEPMKKVKSRAAQFAKVDSTILILGETGTGKEMFTQGIHNISRRSEKPFVAVNCAALPESLLESELFGYVEGAFTGARKGGKPGLFELAHSGTIFLDEISEMSHNLQARFLRVLQEKEIIRIGDDRVIPIDVRIIAATNRDLLEMVKENKFREDLYYRLCVLQLTIPPLKDRADDIPELAQYFVQQKGHDLLDETILITEEAIDRLIEYTWPGNVRQLENVLERTVVLSINGVVEEQTVSEALRGLWSDDTLPSLPLRQTIDVQEGVLRAAEDEIILKVLSESGGNRSMTAKKLGISVTTLWRKLKQLEKE